MTCCPPPAATLCLSHAAAVRAYAAAVEDAVRAYASELPEPCARAVVTYYRPDGTVIERADVGPDVTAACDSAIPQDAS